MRAWRRHHPETGAVTGIRRDGGAASSGVETNRGAIARAQGSRSPAAAPCRHGPWRWPGCACRSRASRSRAYVSEPLKPVLDTVLMFGQVHISVSQSDKGRAGVRAARARTISPYAQARQTSRSLRHSSPPSSSSSRSPAASGCCVNGPGSSTATPGCEAPIISLTPVQGPLRQLRLGHRRLQGDAGLGLGPSPTPSPTTRRTPSTKRSRCRAFNTGRLIDEG